MSDALRRYRQARLKADLRLRRTGLAAAADTARDQSSDVPVYGIAAPFGEGTGDGRIIAAGALEWDLDTESVPILWDMEEGDHSGAVIGTLDSITDTGGALEVTGRLFGSMPDLDRISLLIDENAIGWSLGLDDLEAETRLTEPEWSEERDGTIVIKTSRQQELTTVTHGRVRHLALVDTPAWPVARPVLGSPPALAASALGWTFPADHFKRWESAEPVPLTVTPDGRVWGHGAGDGCFRGDGTCRKYTADPDPDMKNFHVGTACLDDGSVIRVGSLTCSGLHASTDLPTVADVRRHHEDSSTVWARVVAWNDARGRLCIAGSVVPGLDDRTLAQVSGSALSLEAWPVPGTPGLTLVGAHSVIVPAWPVAASTM